MDGTEWLEEVTEDTTVEKLKERCLKHVGYWVLFASPLLLFLVLSLLPGMFAAPHGPCKLSVSVTRTLYL